ncbi:Ankyrin repeat domain containing protein [Pandoravirus neocaledonia]|uniref:Ankyrin repeat domain containing protein n=1 Tax=Pandoravirus neocaledonia TaxID=2107708 RepID=A0A2U7UC25_9VIRU|nr:Ankyrin repeat domain containing protein [Pandoravirus neocaledonia]AVK75905.1 Ankyrin repeat domain containing protein [Pandoravirus neocaledonia]
MEMVGDEPAAVGPAKCPALRGVSTRTRVGRGRAGRPRREASLRSLPNELVAAVASWMAPRELGAALVASRRFHVADKRRIYRALSPITLASAGCLEGLVHKHDTDPWSIDVHCLEAAIAKGRIDVVRWIAAASMGGACPTRVLVSAARVGDIPIVQWAINQGGATVVMDALLAAAKGGHADVLRLLYDGNYPSLTWDSRAIYMAARSGNLEAVRFVYGRCTPPSSDVPPPVACAVIADAVDCVEWLAERCESLSHAQEAFERTLAGLHRDCGIAILTRWPHAACLAQLDDSMPWAKSTLITVDRLDSAVSPSLSCLTVEAIICDLMAGNLPTAAAYDILFDKSLCLYIGGRIRSASPFGFASRLTCDGVLSWCAQRETCAVPFVRDVMIGRRTAFFDMVRQRLQSMSAQSMGFLWESLGGDVEAMECLWKLVAPSGAHTIEQCNADQGDLVDVAQALMDRCQATADKAADADSTAALDWLRMKCGPRARCTIRALGEAIMRGSIEIVERLFTDESHMCRHLVDDDEAKYPVYVALCDGVAIDAAANGNHRAVLELLCARGALSNAWFAYVAATSAITGGHVSLAAWLVSTLHVNMGEGSLCDAADARDMCAVRFLLQAGVPPSREGAALVRAVRSGSLVIAQALDEHDPQCWDPVEAMDSAIERRYENILSWIETCYQEHDVDAL